MTPPVRQDRSAEIDPAATIVACATPPGRGAIAVVRVSGPAVGPAVRAVTGRPVPPARTAVRRRLVDPATARGLDHGLVLWFPAPRSYTGEDSAEFHLHGGPAVVEGVLAALTTLPGLRLATPGEFTRRAFEQGRLDLTEVEAIADLIAAETALQRDQAVRQLDGALADLVEGWRTELIEIMGRLEAVLDFSDQDLLDGVAATAADALDRLRSALDRHLADRRRGERLRTGLSVVIVGAPNVGKSCLLNRLARYDAAIVSSRAGTTRDVIEVRLDLQGVPVTLIDTAGLRDTEDTEDELEQAGIDRAKARAAAADLRIVVFDATADPVLNGQALAWVDDRTIPVINKTDLRAAPVSEIAGRPVAAVSAHTGAGVAELLERLARALAIVNSDAAPAVVTRLRHRQALEGCRDSLKAAQDQLARGLGQADLAAEDLRRAAHCLGRITGRIDVEAWLDVVFREFCIGK